MEQEEKKVLVPWDEYQGLLKDSETLKEAKEELKKDCKERGLYMEYLVTLTIDSLSGIKYVGNSKTNLSPRLSIISKEAALNEAKSEIDRLSNLLKYITEQYEGTIERLKNRNLWERIFNKK